MAPPWWKPSRTFSRPYVAGSSRRPLSSPAPAAHPLLALLHAAPHSSEGLAAALGWPLPEVLAALTELELDGLVCNQAGRWLGRSG